MKLEMTKIAAALAFTLVATGAQAAVVGLTNMQITSGTYSNGFPAPGPQPLSLIGTNDITDQYNLPGWDTSVTQPNGVLAPGASLGYQFGTAPGSQLNGFFAPSAVGSSGGGAAPVFNGLLEDGNVSNIDMRSFFVNAFNSNWNQGNAALPSNGNNPLVTNLTMSGCAGGTCNWTMSWQSTADAGPFANNTGVWALSGTITAVPEASTYGMMLAGIGLVALAARRRRKQVQA